MGRDAALQRLFDLQPANRSTRNCLSILHLALKRPCSDESISAVALQINSNLEYSPAMSRKLSRREFLQTSALATAGAWMAGCQTAPRKLSANEKLNIGI